MKIKELTLNGDKGEIYMVIYKKVENIHLDEKGKIIVERIKQYNIIDRQTIYSWLPNFYTDHWLFAGGLFFILHKNTIYCIDKYKTL